MLTWTDRRIIDQNWAAQADIELVTDKEIKNALSQQIASNIRVIRDRLREVANEAHR
jgi:hypothetical protein